MKKTAAILRTYIGHTGTYFLIVMVAFGLLSVAFGQVSSPFDMAMLWSSLLFAALTALADIVLALWNPAAIARYLLRGVAAIAAFAVSFVLATDVVEDGKTALVGVLAFGVLETILTAIRCIIASVDAGKKNAASEYRNLYQPHDGQ